MNSFLTGQPCTSVSSKSRTPSSSSLPSAGNSPLRIGPSFLGLVCGRLPVVEGVLAPLQLCDHLFPVGSRSLAIFVGLLSLAQGAGGALLWGLGWRDDPPCRLLVFPPPISEPRRRARDVTTVIAGPRGGPAPSVQRL